MAGVGVKGQYPYTNSIYYYWFEFLLRSEKYRKACANGGKGMQKIYDDFGDVFAAKNFSGWWYEPMEDEYGKNNRGAVLFAEPPSFEKVEALKQADIAALHNGWDEDGMAVIAVPLHYSKREIQRQVAKALAPFQKRKAGERTFRESKARYPIHRNFKLAALMTALEWYDVKQANPNMRLWQVATHRTGQISATGRTEADEKNKSGVIAKRTLDLAEDVIAGVEEGKFPMGGRKG